QVPACGPDWVVTNSPNVGTGFNNYLNGVGVVSANDVWAVGYSNVSADQTLVEHWNGSAWSIVPSPNVGTNHNRLNGVEVASANDVWAMGDTYQTLVEHWDGITWSVVSSPNVGTSDNYLTGVAVVSGSDVWAVGYYLNGSNVEQTLVEHW